MNRFIQGHRKLGLVGAAGIGGLVAIAACTSHHTTTTATDDHTNDGTTQIDQTRTFALVRGTVDVSIQGNVEITINQARRDVVVERDRSFLVRDVPTGTVTFEAAILGVRGTLSIDDVKPGEIIEVTIKKEGDSIVIVITRRTAASEPPREVVATTGSTLVVHESNVCYELDAKDYHRDIVVVGDDVSIVGAPSTSCDDGAHAVLDGSLTIQGNGCSVFDVELRGTVTVTGQDARIEDDCTKCFDDECEHGSGDADSGVTGGGGTDGGTTSGGDAGTTPTDAAPPPPTDAGLPPADGGVVPTTDY